MIVADLKNVPLVGQRLRELPQRVERGVEREMAAIAIDLQRYVKQYKLSGQVLKNRTGNLRRAISQKVETVTGRSVAAIVGVQPNAKYGAAHEFGATINVPAVSGKLMVFEKDGKTVFTTKHRAFSVKLPQRSFLRSSLSETKEKFTLRLNAAVARSVR